MGHWQSEGSTYWAKDAHFFCYLLHLDLLANLGGLKEDFPVLGGVFRLTLKLDDLVLALFSLLQAG